MKTLFRNIFLIGVLFCTMTSCTNFLTEDPKGKLMTDSFFSSPSDLDGAINQLYNVVANYVFSSNHTSCGNLLAGDDVTTRAGANKQPLREFDLCSVYESNAWYSYPWGAYFQMVKSANFIINNAGKTPGVSETDIKATLAQAYYWRAFAYFYLVRSYGQLPIMLKEEIKFDTPLSSEQEVYDLIVSDLKIAEADLPVKYTKMPYIQNGINRAVCQPAAKATLGLVYMTMAGWPLNKGNEYYILAAAKLKEVVDGVESGSYQYSLFDAYWKVYSQTFNYSNTELLLGVYFTRDNWEGTTASVCDMPGDMACGGWNDVCGEIKFWKEFPDGPRKDATYLPKLLTTDGKLIDWWDELPDADGKATRTDILAPFFMKTAEMPERGVEFDYTKIDTYLPEIGEKTRQLIRLSQVYCWYAECVGRSGQTNALAVDVLNRVRNRADGKATNLYTTGMSASALAEAAYNEHGWEIAGYYWDALASRYHDMRRMNRVKDHFEYRKQNPLIEVAPGVWRKEKVDFATTVGNGDNTWHDWRMYLPYPLSDAQLNPALAAENKKRN